MRQTKATLFLAGALAALAFAFPAPLEATVTEQRPAQGQRDFTAEAREIERLAEQIVERTGIPGLMITIVQDDRVLVARGIGVVDATTGEKATPDTAYRIASLSKTFAGVLTGVLVRDGIFSWESRVSGFMPALRLPNEQGAELLTIRDILSHQVGVATRAFDRDIQADQPYPVLAARLGEAPATCLPGACYAYQNVAFSLIGDVVFAATGDFFHREVEKRLFHPLGMYSATYGRDALESTPSWARPHVRGARGWVPVRAQETYYRLPPAAGVNASARDMAQWLIANMGRRPEVLSTEVLESVHAPVVRTPDQLRSTTWRRDRLRDAHYAAGWRIYDYAGETLVFHGGAVQGSRAAMGFLPDRGIGVAIVWNSESPAPSGLLPTVIDRALGLPRHDWVQLDRLGR